MWILLISALRHQGGATSIEFSLIGILVAVAVVVGASTLGSSLADTFLNAASAVTDAEGQWLSE